MAAKVQVSSTEDHTYILPCTNNRLVRDCHRLMTVSNINGACKCKAHGRNDTPMSEVVYIGTTGNPRKVMRHTVKSIDQGSAWPSTCGKSRVASNWILWLSGGIVNSSSKSGTEIDAMSRNVINRAHIREFIHYESEVIGIDTPGSDLPAYQWDLETDPTSLKNVLKLRKVASTNLWWMKIKVEQMRLVIYQQTYGEAHVWLSK